MPESERCEFNPHMIWDDFSAPLWVICISLCQNIKIKSTNIILISYGRCYKLEHPTVWWQCERQWYISICIGSALHWKYNCLVLSHWSCLIHSRLNYLSNEALYKPWINLWTYVWTMYTWIIYLFISCVFWMCKNSILVVPLFKTLIYSEVPVWGILVRL